MKIITRTVLSALFLMLWGFLSEYLFMPTWAVAASSGIYLNLIIMFAILAALWYPDYSQGDDKRYFIISGSSGILAVIFFIVFIAIGIGGTWALFHATEYQGLIGDVKTTEFTANIQPVSANNMLIVDEEIAKRIGEKVLGSDPGLGSRAELGKFHLQTVQGKLYWIAPLEHSGFWKWNSFDKVGTPGYVKVSATNQEDCQLVRTAADGRELHIKYQPGAYFSQDLSRHIYTSGYRSTMFTDKTFEVDDEGNPYWTVTLYDSKVGFLGDDAIGVLTVDPETGAIKQYSIDEAPAWIDRIQPESFVRTQIDDWGNYVKGWWNLSHEDVKRAAKDGSLVLGSDGKSYFYFGLTSSGTDNSTIGFAMIDTRTKVTHWFTQAGATEEAAKQSAEGKVQQMQYKGSDGITYNIDGYPTYEFLLKDKAGLMKLIALVNVHDHTIVAVGESRHITMLDYQSKMKDRGNATTGSTSDMEEIIIKSIVSRFAREVVGGNTFYYLTLRNDPSQIYTAGTGLSNELSLTREGDSVKVVYIKGQAKEISLQGFDNLELNIIKDSLQVRNELVIDSLRIERIEKSSEKNIDSEWKKLSPEQKKEKMRK